MLTILLNPIFLPILFAILLDGFVHLNSFFSNFTMLGLIIAMSIELGILLSLLIISKVHKMANEDVVVKSNNNYIAKKQSPNNELLSDLLETKEIDFQDNLEKIIKK